MIHLSGMRWSVVGAFVAAGAAAIVVASTARMRTTDAMSFARGAEHRSARELLEEHWGEEWPRIRPQLEAAHSLDQPIAVSGLTEWPSVRAEVHRRFLEFLAGQRDEWVRQTSGLAGRTSADGAESGIRDEPEIEAQILALCEIAFELMLEADRERIESGDYQLDFLFARPLETKGVETDKEYSATRLWSEYPWFLSYAIDSSGAPGVAEVLQEIARLKHRSHVHLDDEVSGARHR